MLTLRGAKKSDCELLWEWVNDEFVRKFAFNSNPIPWQDHEKWFESRLSADECRIYIIMNGDGDSVGQVRFDLLSDESACIDVSISSHWRGKGYAAQAIELACKRFFAETQVSRIDSEIKVENVASIRTFTRAGFKQLCVASVNGCETARMTLDRANG